MRKIEKAMCDAINARMNWSCGNTRVDVFNDEVSVILHGNCIFRIVDGVKYFSLAGWNTTTTRSRLHALGVGVTQKNFKPVYNGQVIEDNVWYQI